MINCAKLLVEGNTQKRGDSLLAHAVRNYKIFQRSILELPTCISIFRLQLTIIRQLQIVFWLKSNIKMTCVFEVHVANDTTRTDLTFKVYATLTFTDQCSGKFLPCLIQKLSGHSSRPERNIHKSTSFMLMYVY